MSPVWRYALPVDAADRELTAARLWAAGALGLWERSETDLVAWFADRDAPIPSGGTWTEEEDRDWQAEWKATIGPVVAGRIVVVPSWLADTHLGGPDELTIVLDPGRAFGTGHHATTTLCLEALQAPEVEERLVGGRVLDVGTGSGILGIGASLLGAREVVAVDVDAAAIEVAGENMRRNGVALGLAVGSVDAAGAPGDVVLANLVTGTLVELAGELTGLVGPGGALIASGIAAGHEQRVVDALDARADWTSWTVVGRDGWVAVRGQRRRPR